MRIIITISFLYLLYGCSAAGVMHTSDPYKKIDLSYNLMLEGRLKPSKKLAKEALDEFMEKNDNFGQGAAHMILGSLYKSPTQKNKLKSIHHFQQAVKQFSAIKDFKNSSRAKYDLANAYGDNSEASKQFRLYAESLRDYAKSNPNKKAVFNPAFSSFNAMIKDFTKQYCK